MGGGGTCWDTVAHVNISFGIDVCSLPVVGGFCFIFRILEAPVILSSNQSAALAVRVFESSCADVACTHERSAWQEVFEWRRST